MSFHETTYPDLNSAVSLTLCLDLADLSVMIYPNLTSVVSFISVSSVFLVDCTNLSECVRGTRVEGAGAVAALERDLACFAQEGRWANASVPRWISWNKIDNPPPEHPDYGSCDVMHEKL